MGARFRTPGLATTLGDPPAVTGKRDISKRRLLSGIVTALVSLAHPFKTRAASSSGIIAGAIRWDAWYSRTGSSVSAQDNLSYEKFRARAPVHCKLTSESKLSCIGTQEVMDSEISTAAKAGIKFWAFVWYRQESSLHEAWSLYQSSGLRDHINWCGIVPIASLGSIPFEKGQWQTTAQQWADYMVAHNYQKVSADGVASRPLLFLLWDQAQLTEYFGSLENLGRALSFLRERVSAAGLGPPYIVVLHGSEGSEVLSKIGAQAISSYIPRFRREQAGSYADLDKQTREYWTKLQSTGKEIVPTAIVGWDTRPRQEHPGPFRTGQNPNAYYAMSHPAELVEHIRAAIQFIKSNIVSCPSKVLLIYSWDECDEGGGLIPTLGDPAGSYLAAIAPLIN